MEQDRKVAGGRASSSHLARVVTEEAHAVSAVDDLRLPTAQQRACAARQERPSHLEARKNGLNVVVRKPAWRREGRRRGRSKVGCQRSGVHHESSRMAVEPGSVATKSGPTSNAGVV